MPAIAIVHSLQRMAAQPPFRVVIAGGGVAAVEAALALRELAGERVALQIVAPDDEFVYRPMSVREPFAYAPAERYPLADIAADVGAELIVERFGWVEPAARVAHTESGTALPYDALILALGARMRPPFSHGVVIDDRRMDELLHGIVQDVESGYIHRLAFVSPVRMGWPLPLYELAFLIARRAYEMGATVELTIVTPEPSPLTVFGEHASAAVAQLLADAGIGIVTGADARVTADDRVVIGSADHVLDVDRAIVLPELFGPAVRGIPGSEHGFIPIDAHCQVRGVERVYAAGDATDFEIKQGGVAAQQADTVAQAIAALGGAPVTPGRFQPEIHGMLLTGGRPRYLSAALHGGRGVHSEISDEPPDGLTGKITARYLGPYLAQRAG